MTEITIDTFVDAKIHDIKVGMFIQLESLIALLNTPEIEELPMEKKESIVENGYDAIVKSVVLTIETIDKIEQIRERENA